MIRRDVKGKKESEDEKPIGFFNPIFILFIGAIILIFGIICFLPKWLIKPATSSNIDFSDTGQIGDTIGGIMGPFVAMCAAILTFLAFWVQYKANQQQVRQFGIQAKDARIDRFENRLSELIKIHRDNLNEIKVLGITGRKAFITFFKEIRLTYFCVSKYFNSLPSSVSNDGLKNDGATALDVAYRIFYLGVGPGSNKLLYISLADKLDKSQIEGLIKRIEQIKSNFTARQPLIINKIEFKMPYRPFDGHISKLGHYYRHLYHIIKFIDKQDEKFINEEQKCDYAKTVRAQLSDYEQLVLFYNINSVFGVPWISDGYIRKYRIIKNMPLPLTDFGVIPAEKFKEDIKYWEARDQYFFQWDERKWPIIGADNNLDT